MHINRITRRSGIFTTPLQIQIHTYICKSTPRVCVRMRIRMWVWVWSVSVGMSNLLKFSMPHKLLAHPHKSSMQTMNRVCECFGVQGTCTIFPFVPVSSILPYHCRATATANESSDAGHANNFEYLSSASSWGCPVFTLLMHTLWRTVCEGVWE